MRTDYVVVDYENIRQKPLAGKGGHLPVPGDRVTYTL